MHIQRNSMKFITLGSGSSGNCYFLFTDTFGLIIDQGIGIRKFKKYFSDYGLNQGRINAVLATHGHTDHVKAVGVMSQTYNVPVYAAQRVHDSMATNFLMTKKVEAQHRKIIEPGEKVQIGPFTVEAFDVPHDSNGNNGYLITEGDTTFCLMTDCGHFTDEMQRMIARAQYLVIEANYDRAMLMSGRYPQRLKERITCGTGHCSNKQTGEALRDNLQPHIKKVWLCHLSEENNRPEICLETVRLFLRDLPFEVDVEPLRRRVPSEVCTLG